MRSEARKSGRLSPGSASTTPTSVTPGKSWPLVTICVPTRTSISRARNGVEDVRMSPSPAAVSRSSRAMRAPGSDMREELLELLGAEPMRSTAGLPHAVHFFAGTAAKPQ